jgi:transcriptional regulator with XRE-family HTH domain
VNLSNAGAATQQSGNGAGDGELGGRIRAYRRMRKLTLRQVADHAGVTESFLSQLERGTSGASVSTLRLVAEALGLKVADLFEDTGATGLSVLAADKRPVIHMSGFVKFMLTRRPLQNLEVFEGVLEPGASTTSQEYRHGDSQELVYVLHGDVMLYLGDEEHRLGERDSIEYRSSLTHSLMNVGDADARVLWIISPPSL